MKDQKRRKIWTVLFFATAAVCLINWFALPEVVVSGIHVRGSVRSELYSTKVKIVSSGLVYPLVGQVFWNTVVKRLERKVEAHPKVYSYQSWRGWAVAGAWMCAAGGLIVNLAALFLNF